jgi:hypothetical protein
VASEAARYFAVESAIDPEGLRIELQLQVVERAFER